MKRNFISACLTCLCAALVCACSPKAEGPLLCGTAQFQNPEIDFAVNYLPDGDIYQAKVIDLKVDSTGHYEFNMELPDGPVDIEVYVDAQLFGAHLEKGKTARLDFKQNADGQVECTFGGDNADVSQAVSDGAQTSDLFSMQGMNYAEAKATTDQRHQKAMASAQAIGDKDLRDYYTRLEEARYTGTCLRLLSDRAIEEKCKETDFPEYAQLIATIDPNSDIDYAAMNSILWVMAQPKTPRPDFKGDYSAYCIELIDLTDSLITNPKLRKQMAYAIPQQFFGYGDHESGKEAFWTRYQEFAKDYPEYIEAFKAEYEKVVRNMDGQPVPDITLERPDGSKVSIKSLQGKYTYIDVWATWCGPCCKEIPFVEKLVEQFKGNTKLQFVSFSVDSDRKAWEAKLEADKPAWQQFILDADANKTLSDALAINGIPRFIVLGPDGTIINQDAQRPSDPELVEYLNGLTK